MRPSQASVALMLLVISMPALLSGGGQGAIADAPAVDDDEYAVLAAAVTQTQLSSAPRWFLLVDRTTTLECPTVRDRTRLGPCDGMRKPEDTTETVFERLRAALPEFPRSTWVDLVRKSVRPSTLMRTLPVETRHILWNAGPTPPEELKTLGPPAFALYLSRVGFAEQRNNAVVYLGVLHWTEASRTAGDYVYLVKRSTGWSVAGRSRVWQLIP